MHVILHVIVCNVVCNEWCNAVCNESYYIAYYMPLHEILHACYMTLKFWEVLHVMACNWHVITCHYMHYMPLHAIDDANGNRWSGRLGTATGRSQASFLNKPPTLTPRAEVLVHWCFRPKEVKHIFQSTKYLPTNKTFSWSKLRSFSEHDNANENSPPELQNTPNWIVGLT